jgi:hypothetical protein
VRTTFWALGVEKIGFMLRYAQEVLLKLIRHPCPTNIERWSYEAAGRVLSSKVSYQNLTTKCQLFLFSMDLISDVLPFDLVEAE